MKYLKLRIAFSIICTTACLVLIVLWTRSYRVVDNIIGPPNGLHRFGVSSAAGWLTIRWTNSMGPDAFPQWTIQSRSVAQMEAVYKQMEDSIRNQPGATFKRPVFKFGLTGNGAIQFQYWLPTLIAGAIAAVTTYRRRYSLRTLLVATTLIAVVLGLAVYATGK